MGLFSSRKVGNMPLPWLETKSNYPHLHFTYSVQESFIRVDQYMFLDTQKHKIQS